MAAQGFLFDLAETLGSVFVDASGCIESIEVYSHVAPLLERLSKEGLALAIIANTESDRLEQVDNALGATGLHQYFPRDLRIYSSGVGLPKPSVEIFELALERLRVHGVEASHCVFVGESRAERTVATLVGMKAAPHPLLAEAVLVGETPIYVQMEVPVPQEADAWIALQKVPVVPLYRENVDGTAQTIAISTDNTVSRLQAAGFSVQTLPDDAVRGDLYLLRDAGGLDQDAGFVAGLRGLDIAPVLSSTSGLFVALPPQQNIDAFHFGKGHGHNHKLLADFALIPRVIGAHPPTFSSELSPAEMQSIGSVITEGRMRETLQFVTATTPQPLAASEKPARNERTIATVGSNRHVYSPQMRAVTDGLMAAFERIGRGAFVVSGHRFEVAGADVRNLKGVPVADRVTLYNVIAELPGATDEFVLVTAHLDSTAKLSYGDEYDPRYHDAPGMDDDGSGTAAVLLIAEVMRNIFAGRRPRCGLRFVLFNAEEQGLIGSGRYARCQASKDVKIAGVFQLDMVGYNRVAPNAFETHAGTSKTPVPADPEIENRSLKLSHLVGQMAELLRQEKLSILTPAEIHRSPDEASGRSDHASFQYRGYPACVTCEDLFPFSSSEGNPNYHRATDLFVDLEFAASVARVVCAAALRVSDPTPSAGVGARTA